MSKTIAVPLTFVQVEQILKMGEFFKKFNYDNIFYDKFSFAINEAMVTQFLHEKIASVLTNVNSYDDLEEQFACEDYRCTNTVYSLFCEFFFVNFSGYTDLGILCNGENEDVFGIPLNLTDMGSNIAAVHIQYQTTEQNSSLFKTHKIKTMIDEGKTIKPEDISGFISNCDALKINKKNRILFTNLSPDENGVFGKNPELGEIMRVLGRNKQEALIALDPEFWTKFKAYQQTKINKE